MKQGLDQVHTKALIDFLEKRQLHPMDALRIMSIASLTIIGSYIEYDMKPEEKMALGEDIDSFASQLRELLHVSEEDLFAILVSVQMLQRELLESAVNDIEQAAKEVQNGKPSTPMS